MDTHDTRKYDGKEDRNYYLKPFDEVTDELPQIDDESAAMAVKRDHKGTGAENAEAQTGKSYTNDINDTDERDPADSTRDWDAENNRTGRRK